MARYDHLPIYRAAFDLAVHLEQIVRHFDRYHKYTLGTDLRTGSRRILERIIEANESRDRRPVLERLRQDLEQLKVLARLCHESGGFRSTRAYLHVAEQVVASATPSRAATERARSLRRRTAAPRAARQVETSRRYNDQMITNYIAAALRRARYQTVEGGLVCATVPGLRGVIATAATVEGCRTELAEVIEAWLLVRVARGLRVPPLGRTTVQVKRAS